MKTKKNRERAMTSKKDCQHHHTGMDLALAVVGSRYRLALKLGISPAAVHKWKDIPVWRVLEVERITHIDRAKLRPDLFNRERAAGTP